MSTGSSCRHTALPAPQPAMQTGNICPSSGIYTAKDCSDRFSREFIAGDKFAYCCHGKPTAWQPAKQKVGIKIAEFIPFVIVLAATLMFIAEHNSVISISKVHPIVTNKIFGQADAILSLLVGQATIMLIIASLPQRPTPKFVAAVATLTATIITAGFLQMENKNFTDLCITLGVMTPLFVVLGFWKAHNASGSQTTASHATATDIPDPKGQSDNLVQLEILCEIAGERRRQDHRWGFRATRSDELMLTLTVEELGKCARAMQPDNDDAGDLDQELLQTAALIVQWLELRRRRAQTDTQEQ